MEIKLERIYTKPADLSGYRVLVDRLWPRGISKVNAQLDWWAKEIGPSTELRKWFDHDPKKFEEFSKKYETELNTAEFSTEFMTQIKKQLQTQDVIFLYGAKDEKHNQAVILKTYVEAKLAD
ncbi:putative uroporphyrin-III c-methyltransferase [Pediococcus damnosus]|uniref:Uroporphyrin-III c-methyltransferase n=1 Tax=Pediococcus damnosus TaxID=51663 RepID=A0A0R2HM84_9LACO|nr:DUF488 family protein [Pediococcus damnosus]AMV60173.1 putative uroporphyrin-III c-methyltransferase [Pediococcus damnosus]AMV62693.1 putative uroporphyrin-III c-methyltransferase [Pediococcus damnosus]AMV64417.1 putative uroporphyrin-III c-methyltransferase [Pediococcus damnosus]AMV67422.1 putative uroporphyrin-III c-methyltransferase [Pediococcus damnosus]AMV69720.1 putative uroporphyrin-III c-methyltransferase [Pediococcus damnosus]